MSKTDLKTGDINCAVNPRKRAYTNTVEWNEINWRKVEKSVFKLHSSNLSSRNQWQHPQVTQTTKNLNSFLPCQITSGQKSNPRQSRKKDASE